MLSQRIAFFAQLLNSDRDNADYQAELANAITLFENSHEWLVGSESRSEFLGISDALRLLYFPANQGPGLDAQSRNFVQMARQVLQSKAESQASVQYLISEAKAPLLTKLDSAVKGFELLAKKKLASFERTEKIGFYLSVAGLGFLVLLVFVPAHRSLINSISRLEAEISEKTKLARVASETTNAVIITDRQGKIEWVNSGFERLTGYSQNEVLGLKPGDFLQGEQTNREVAAQISRQLKAGQGFEATIVNYTKDQKPYWVKILCQSYQARQGGIKFMAIESDVTEEVELSNDLKTAKQKAEAANLAKSEFLATMSHEIRTPMAAVMGFADALLDDDLPAESQSKVRQIKQSALSLLEIINEVLDISKLEAGRLAIEHIDFHLASLVRDIVSMFEGSGRRDLHVKLAASNDLPDGIHGDPTRLRQVLINLVGNAVKFTKEGQVTLSVERRSTGNGDDILYFAVIDTGIGIADEVLPKLFNEFTQADSSISREFEGTGLGLAICKRLVELMGGEIGAESKLGEGSTFWFTLPYHPAKSEVAEQEFASNTAMTTQTLRALHILVAEDNQVNQLIVSQTLDHFGHTYQMVNDGEEAVDALEKRDFDLILMDVRMPKVSGPEATRMIRKMTGSKARIPIIALTADAMLEHQKVYFEAGMDGVSTKPIIRFDLAKTINEVMKAEIHAFVPTEAAAEANSPSMESPTESDPENKAVTAFLADLEGFGEHSKPE